MDKGVMEDAITCTVCSEEYKAGIHDPLILSCGHTFCRDCIDNIRKTKTNACPTCRVKIEEKIENLPMNFSILSLSENIIQFKPKTCQRHGKLLDLWCGKCQMVVCGLCIVIDHREETHEILSAQEHLATMRTTFLNQGDVISQMISKRQTELGFNTKHVLVSLLSIFKDHSQLKALSSETSDLSKEAYKMTNTEAMELCQVKFNSLHSAVASIPACEMIPGTPSVDTSDNDTSENATPVAEKDAHPLRGLPSPGLPRMEVNWPLSISVKDATNRYANLTWEDNKFLLSAFQEKSISSHITIQWNIFATLLPTKIPEAFMDLAQGDHYLGRVYIRLWGHLRRAHHFLALCLGSLGPSYTGGVFRSSHKDEQKERICGCVYKAADGSSSTRGVMEDLEWDGQYAGRSGEGRIVGTSGGKSEMDSLFSIYTKVHNNASCYCPFGEVSSGLDVVRKAIECTPATSVFIKRCGAVLPTSALRQLH